MAGENEITAEEVRAEMVECRDEINTQLEAGRLKMDELHDSLKEIQKMKKSLDEFLELWAAGEGFVKVVKAIGRTVKWLAVTGGAIAIVWGAFMYLVHGSHR